MSTSVVITLSPRAKALLAAAPAWPLALKSAIAAAMDVQNELTTGHIQRTKLSVRGPFTLGVRTNRLRLSARPTKAIVAADTILSSIGSNVKYAGVHEFGFTGTVQVRGFTRRQVSNDIVGGKRRGFVSRQKREKVSANGIARVGPFTRRANIPARAMFRTGITERLPSYSAALSRAVITTLNPPAAA
jgi:hypothetical protein